MMHLVSRVFLRIIGNLTGSTAKDAIAMIMKKRTIEACSHERGCLFPSVVVVSHGGMMLCGMQCFEHNGPI
jgi:hypothetical protein